MKRPFLCFWLSICIALVTSPIHASTDCGAIVEGGVFNVEHFQSNYYSRLVAAARMSSMTQSEANDKIQGEASVPLPQTMGLPVGAGFSREQWSAWASTVRQELDVSTLVDHDLSVFVSEADQGLLDAWLDCKRRGGLTVYLRALGQDLRKAGEFSFYDLSAPEAESIDALQTYQDVLGDEGEIDGLNGGTEYFSLTIIWYPFPTGEDVLPEAGEITVINGRIVSEPSFTKGDELRAQRKYEFVLARENRSNLMTVHVPTSLGDETVSFPPYFEIPAVDMPRLKECRLKSIQTPNAECAVGHYVGPHHVTMHWGKCVLTQPDNCDFTVQRVTFPECGAGGVYAGPWVAEKHGGHCIYWKEDGYTLRSEKIRESKSCGSEAVYVGPNDVRQHGGYCLSLERDYGR